MPKRTLKMACFHHILATLATITLLAGLAACEPKKENASTATKSPESENAGSDGTTNDNRNKNLDLRMRHSARLANVAGDDSDFIKNSLKLFRDSCGALMQRWPIEKTPQAEFRKASHNAIPESIANKKEWQRLVRVKIELDPDKTTTNKSEPPRCTFDISQNGEPPIYAHQEKCVSFCNTKSAAHLPAYAAIN